MTDIGWLREYIRSGEFLSLYMEIKPQKVQSLSLYLLWLISRGVRGPLVDMDLHHAKVKFAELLGKIAGSNLE